MYLYNLGQRFEEVVKENGYKIAVIIGDTERVTFDELNCLSNRMCNYFISRGLKKRDVVAIQNNKTAIGFATMIACLKLGVIYTNFDYTNPIERIKKIFTTANPKLVLADKHNGNVESLCKEISIPYYVADENEIEANILDFSCEISKDILESVSGNNPAYIMFTSGSTGIPKGVLISQRSLLNFIRWGKETYQLKDNDIMTNVNPIYFDNSVFDFYCSVFNGITMLAIPKNIVEQPKKMLEIIHEQKCTFWFSVPSMLIYLMNLRLLTKEILEDIRIFSFGGEGYPKELLRKLYNMYKETSEFYNVYGPTEGTCICSAYKITQEDMDEEGLAPLGKIAPNFDYVILDESGVENNLGELCLIGDQLALGYYNDKVRTEKSFVLYQGIDTYYERMYKTGDLVEMIDDKLYFRGRVDNQIKHMGYRIELEEIENALIKLEGMEECAVIHTVSKNNFSKIVAYMVMDVEREQAQIRKELQRYLPGYMIPNDFIFLDQLPKNANGKIDRVSLKSMWSGF